MGTTVSARPGRDTPLALTWWRGHRQLLVVLATIRLAVAGLAVPLAPVLYREERIAVLVLLRPSKEVLLLAGFAVAQGDAWLPTVVVAALPLLLGAVWLLFAVGRVYADDLEELGRNRWVAKILPPKRIRHVGDAVAAEGAAMVLLGRVAAFPSTLVGAAAGAADVPVRRFLAADAAGAVLSLTVLLAAGYVLEDAYDEAGPWFTAAGVLGVAAAAFLLRRAVRARVSRRSG